jgi:gluconokinase
MGVAGSGKSTVGRLLAERLECVFHEGDDFHPRTNVDKMSRGLALADEDRLPWLATLRDLIARESVAGADAVLACSALRRSYRNILRQGGEDVRFVYLKGDFETIHARMTNRGQHFMKENMLRSQFADLEEPLHAMVVDIDYPPDALVSRIAMALDVR